MRTKTFLINGILKKIRIKIKLTNLKPKKQRIFPKKNYKFAAVVSLNNKNLVFSRVKFLDQLGLKK